MAIIDDEQNFIALYKYSAGKSEVPAIYHFWCALSIIAACVQDRVWYKKFQASELNPNLYIILEGESAGGKGEAINHAAYILGDMKNEINWYDGTITSPQLVQWLHKRRTIYLIVPELGTNFDFPSGAQRFIRLVTALYAKKESHIEGTIAHGFVEIKNQVINWIAGSTKEWIVDAVPKNTVQSGFFGRTLLIHGERSKEKVLDPVYPPDNDEVIKYLREQCEIYTTIQGEFTLSEQAERVRALWYDQREDPDDPLLLPTRKREDDMILKVAMLLMLANTAIINKGPNKPGVLKIGSNHMRQAQQVVSEAQDAIKILAATVEVQELPPMAKAFHRFSGIIQRSGTITKSALSQRSSKFCPTRKERDQYLVELITLGLVKTTQTKSGGVIVQWVDQRKKIPRAE